MVLDSLGSAISASVPAGFPQQGAQNKKPHCSRYLASTRDLSLVIRRPDAPTAPVVWTDSNYAPNYGTAFDNCRSTSGYVVTHNGTALSWRSRRQRILATSSCEAETIVDRPTVLRT